ncbi:MULTISPECIES: hypothetical protein [unclassified Methanoregula]|uniref:hypothetical protein n=1 Tax=unclassified Methanoregula TaxID=2649730 RepID=UPI0025F6F39F|nr:MULTISPECIES: hypothetical protein [unclassified Methanoregula]
MSINIQFDDHQQYGGRLFSPVNDSSRRDHLKFFMPILAADAGIVRCVSTAGILAGENPRFPGYVPELVNPKHPAANIGLVRSNDSLISESTRISMDVRIPAQEYKSGNNPAVPGR